MKFRTKYFIAYLAVCLVQDIAECYFKTQALNSFDGALRHYYEGVRLEDTYTGNIVILNERGY